MCVCVYIYVYVYVYIYMCIYIYIYMVTPPPPSTDPGSIFPICSGRGRGEEHHSKIPRVSKNPKIQKNPTQVSDFWKLEEFAQNPKKPKIPRVSKIQKSKNPNPSPGFLETRGICSKSKKPKIPRVSKNPKAQKSQPQFRIFGNSRNLLKIQKTQNSSSFQKSKNPKIPTPVSDFWKLEEFAQNPKKPKIPRVSKIKKSKNPNPSFGFLETRGICSKSKKIQKSPSFQKSETGVGVFGFLEFWKLEEFWVFLDFEQIPRVSKNPKLGLGFLDFWNFGNSRNFGVFWISRLPPEFLKIQTLGWNCWILGILETRGILGFFGF